MKKTGVSLIVAGVLLLLGAAGLTAYNISDSMRARQAVEAIIGPIAQAIEQQEPSAFVRPESDAIPEMPVRVQDGRRYIGIIEIPALSLSLPVLENWSYDLLKVSPCRYTGSYYTNDLVICAHNYASHFNGLRYIDIGSDVYFTAVNGMTFHYVIDNRETLTPEENDRMITSNGEWDLTLFTCYIGGATRCTLRCSLVSE
jgi:sortase A